jgi:phenylacetate-CoA ligase
MIKRDDLYQLIKLYRESQYWPYQKLLHYQQTKIEELVRHANDNVPYYKDLFSREGLRLDRISDPDNFKKIPFLTKDIIRDPSNNLMATNINRKYAKPNSTSGSSGSNLKFFSDMSVFDVQAMLFRNIEWMGLNFFDRKVIIWGASWDVSLANKFIPSIKQKLKKQVVLSGYRLSDKTIREYHQFITKFKPKLIRSYPSILFTIAEYFEQNNLAYYPVAIESAGEKLHPFQREKIEQVFKTKIFDFYGARDIPLIAQECEAHHGLHVMMENVLLEVVDDGGNPMEEGEGDLVLTHLHNKVMPFIRYKIGDRARISKRTCTCGRNLPLIEEVIGRSFEIIEFPNGNKVGGSFWTLVMRSVPGVKDFQVVQEAIDQITINYISEEGNIKESLNNLKKRIEEYSGPRLKINFNEVDESPLTKGGKFQFVVSNIKK